jgi:steroid delta-isomerase-like uncharacterized protein
MAPVEAGNRDAARRIIDDVWNDGDLAAVDDLFADEYVMRNPGLPEEIRGPDGFRGVVRQFRSAFPDIDWTIEHLLDDDDMVHLHYTVRGTHEGELMGIPPTGESVEFTGMTLLRFEDGKAVDDWGVYDALGLMQQLGVGPDLRDLAE